MKETKAKALPAKPPPPKTEPAPVKPKKKKAKCVFDYAATQDDEITLKVGDIVVLTKDEADGWCEGELPGGKKGMFPSNFVEFLGDDNDISAHTASSAATVEPEVRSNADGLSLLQESQPKKVQMQGGVGFGNIFQGGVPILKKVDAGRTAAARPESTFLAPTLRATMKQPSRDGKKNVDTRPLYKTLFEYTAANDDELSFKPGQLIRLLSKEDGGWWKGELEGGKSGWFPDNFVEPASEAESQAAIKEEPEPEPEKKTALVPPKAASFISKPKLEEAHPAPAVAAPPPHLPTPVVPVAAPPALPKKPASLPADEPPAPTPLPRTASNATREPVPAPAAKPKPPPPVSKAKPLVPKAADKDVHEPDDHGVHPVETEKKESTPAAAPSRAISSAPVHASLSAADAAKISELTETVRTLKEDLDRLRGVKDDFDKLRKQMSILTSDLDEEVQRAARLKMQVEIDRIKKLQSVG